MRPRPADLAVLALAVTGGCALWGETL